MWTQGYLTLLAADVLGSSYVGFEAIPTSNTDTQVPLKCSYSARTVSAINIRRLRSTSQVLRECSLRQLGTSTRICTSLALAHRPPHSTSTSRALFVPPYAHPYTSHTYANFRAARRSNLHSRGVSPHCDASRGALTSYQRPHTPELPKPFTLHSTHTEKAASRLGFISAHPVKHRSTGS